MTLKEHIRHLNDIAHIHGDDLEVITSIDDEGNGYRRIFFEPSAGMYNEDDREYISIENFEEWEVDKNAKITHVCTN